MAMTTDAVLELIKETAEQVIRPRWRALSSCLLYTSDAADE